MLAKKKNGDKKAQSGPPGVSAFRDPNFGWDAPSPINERNDKIPLKKKTRKKKKNRGDNQKGNPKVGGGGNERKKRKKTIVYETGYKKYPTWNAQRGGIKESRQLYQSNNKGGRISANSITCPRGFKFSTHRTVHQEKMLAQPRPEKEGGMPSTPWGGLHRNLQSMGKEEPTFR